jgi:hypothetical protein
LEFGMVNLWLLVVLLIHNPRTDPYLLWMGFISNFLCLGSYDGRPRVALPHRLCGVG